MFVVLDETNTARVTLNDCVTGNTQTVDTLNEPRAIHFAAVCFARSNGIALGRVQTSVVYP